MKRIMLLVSTIAIYNLCYAQVGFGIKAGANIAKLTFSNTTYSVKPIVRPHAGIFINIGITTPLHLQAELLYSAEGNTWKSGSTTGKIKESQVRIPVLAQYNVAKNIFVEAGVQYNLLISIKQSRNGGEYEDLRDLYKLGVFGYAIGAGYNFGETVKGLRASARLNGDFSRINADAVGGNDLKNSIVQISASYTLSKNARQ